MSGIIKQIKNRLRTTNIFPVTLVRAVYDDDGTSLTAIITNLKKSVSDGKSSIASAITAKGVTTEADDTFDTMATNIGKISGASGTATAAQVLTGYTFSNDSGSGISGSMANNGALNWNPSSSTSASVSAGYYSGGTISTSNAYSAGYTNSKTNLSFLAGVNSTTDGSITFFCYPNDIITVLTGRPPSVSGASLLGSCLMEWQVFTITESIRAWTYRATSNQITVSVDVSDSIPWGYAIYHS